MGLPLRAVILTRLPRAGVNVAFPWCGDKGVCRLNLACLDAQILEYVHFALGANLREN